MIVENNVEKSRKSLNQVNHGSDNGHPPKPPAPQATKVMQKKDRLIASFKYRKK